jgi:hypothetical protein
MPQKFLQYSKTKELRNIPATQSFPFAFATSHCILPLMIQHISPFFQLIFAYSQANACLPAPKNANQPFF